MLDITDPSIRSQVPATGWSSEATAVAATIVLFMAIFVSSHFAAAYPAPPRGPEFIEAGQP